VPALSYALALLVTGVVVLLLVGAGELAGIPPSATPSPLGAIAFRCVVGLAVLPGAPIALHELLGMRVRADTAVAIGSAGLVLLFLRYRRSRPKLERDELVLLLLAAGIGFACLKGSLLSPTFLGRDPWPHALGIRYVADVGSLRQPDPSWPTIQYVDAYPPLFDVLLSVPVTLAGSLNLPVKAFNAFLTGLGVLAFHLLATRLLDGRRAVVATLFYAALPGNLSRHVWGHSVALILLFGGLAAALEARADRRWVWPGALCLGGALLAAPSQGIVNGTLLILLLAVGARASREWGKRLLATGVLALLVASVWFAGVVRRYGTDPVAITAAMQAPELRRSGATVEAIRSGAADPGAPFAGGAPRRYGLDDLLTFRPYRFVLEALGEKSMDDVVPEGIGVPAAVLTLLFGGLLVAGRAGGPERQALALWLVAALAGLLGPWFGLRFFPWRFWLTLAPLVCLAAADALVWLAERGPAPSRARTAALAAVGTLLLVDVALAVRSDAAPDGLWRYLPRNPAFLALPIAAGLWLTERRPGRALVGGVVAAHLLVAGPARLRSLTRYVPPQAFFDVDEHRGYLELLRVTPQGAAVYPLSGGKRFEVLVGLDRTVRPYRSDELDFERRVDGLSTPEVVAWLRAHRYRYVVLDPTLHDRDPALFARRAEELSGERPILDRPTFRVFELR